MAASAAVAGRQYGDQEVRVAPNPVARPAPGEAIGHSRFRSYESGLSQKWQQELVQKIIAMVSQPPGWNSYGAPPLRRDTAMFALEVLNSIMQPRTPIPAVVQSGIGVQFEWHERGIDLELHITAPYEWEIWFEDHQAEHDPVSDALSNNFGPAKTAVAILTRR